MIGVGGDPLNALRLNHMIACTAMNGMIVYSRPQVWQSSFKLGQSKVVKTKQNKKKKVNQAADTSLGLSLAPPSGQHLNFQNKMFLAANIYKTEEKKVRPYIFDQVRVCL